MSAATRIAMLFPGQGSQYPQMARDLLRCRSGRAVLAEAEAVCGLPLTSLMSTADAATLADPEIAQLSVLTHSLTLWDQLVTYGADPAMVAGHSLGEYTAMVAAGMLDRTDALILVSRRGRAMAEASRARPGAMGAVVGLHLGQIERMCHEHGERAVVVANVNSARQVVVSGLRAAVEAVLDSARSAGALRAKLLPVGGAYHSPLMAEAAATMTALWRGVVLSPPRFPFLSSMTGALVADPDEQARLMLDQVGVPVQWRATMTTIQAGRVDAVVEVGPGRVLSGLAREQAPGLPQLVLRPGATLAFPVTSAA